MALKTAITLFLLSIAKSGRGTSATNTPPSADELISCLNEIIEMLATSVYPPRRQDEMYHRTRSLLENQKELMRFRRWIATTDRLAANCDDEYFKDIVIEQVLGRLEDRIGKRGLKKRIVNQSAAIGSATISGLAWSVANGDFVGMTLGGRGLLRRFARKFKMFTVRVDGDKWPFYFAVGSENLFRKEAAEIVRTLREAKRGH